MSIQEIAIRHEDGKLRMVHINIDGMEYQIFGIQGRYITIIAGKRWINDRRTLGRTFYEHASIPAYYKKHGKILDEYASRIRNGQE